MKKRFRNLLLGIFVVAVFFEIGVQAVQADIVELIAARDVTIFSNGNSNGAGSSLFCGRTGTSPGPSGIQHRALMAFDVASAIAPGSTITSAALEMTLSAASLFGSDNTHTLHRVLSDWGEGESDVFGGAGAAPQAGDATWEHTFYPDQFWDTEGGDFDPTVSGSAVVGGPDDVATTYIWGSTLQMVADVQLWVDDPQSDFGWMMIGDEANFHTAKTFGSRTFGFPDQLPRLIVEFEPPACAYDCGEADGEVNVVDLLALLAQWGAGGSCDADGGGVDIEDLLALLAAWGPCP